MEVACPWINVLPCFVSLISQTIAVVGQSVPMKRLFFAHRPDVNVSPTISCSIPGCIPVITGENTNSEQILCAVCLPRVCATAASGVAWSLPEVTTYMFAFGRSLCSCIYRFREVEKVLSQRSRGTRSFIGVDRGLGFRVEFAYSHCLPPPVVTSVWLQAYRKIHCDVWYPTYTARCSIHVSP